MQDQICYKIPQAAAYSGLSKKVLWGLIKAGKLKAFRPKTAKVEGGQIIEHAGDMMIWHEDLITYLRENQEAVT